MADHEAGWVSEAEFATWLSPPFALQVLRDGGLERTTAVSRIVDRASEGLIAAQAQTIKKRASGRDSQAEHVLIPPAWWPLTHVLHAWDEFWSTGDCSLQVHNYPSNITYKLFGVRFEPGGVRSILPAAPVAQAVEVVAPPRLLSGPNELPKVSRAALRAWYSQFAERNPDAVEREVIAAAEAHFPKFRVSRQPIRDLIGELGTGKSRGIQHFAGDNGE